MQWGTTLRWEGWKARANEETIDGQVKCEKWIRDDDSHSEESKVVWWLNRLIGRTKKVTIDWPHPFAEGRLFVLTVSAGLEGYHIKFFVLCIYCLLVCFCEFVVICWSYSVDFVRCVAICWKLGTPF